MYSRPLGDEVLKRGTVVFVKNNRPGSRVMDGNHPAVIVQNNKGNEVSPTVIVCFLTTKVKRPDMKTHVVLEHYKYLKRSQIVAEQICTIDKNDILGIVTQLRPKDIAAMDRAILFSLGLGGK